MTFVSRNHGIFTFFAKFYVRCRKWRRKEHIRRKRLCNRPSGLFSPFLFGISLIFWNIFGVYASSGVNTMGNKTNFNFSTTKIDNDTNNNKEHSITTTTTTLSLVTEILTVTATCEDKTCSMPSEPRPSDNECPSDFPCDDLDFSVCNMNYNMTESERTSRVCEKNDYYDYTCVLDHSNVTGDEGKYCPAQSCLDLAPNSYNCCAKCLCETRDKDKETKEYLNLFDNILSRVDCKRKYSLWNCIQCKAVYRDWLCAVNGLYQFENETKPCLDMCTSVMSHCPYLVPIKLYGGSPSFLCPEFSDLNSTDEYAHEGKCFKCNGAEHHNYNESQPCEYIRETSGSRGLATKFVLPVWLIFLMRICVYFNTASYS